MANRKPLVNKDGIAQALAAGDTLVDGSGTPYGTGTGTVTSVGVSSSTLTVGGTNPVTGAGTITVEMPAVVGAGSATNASIAVDAEGRVTAFASGSAPPTAANPSASVGPAAVNGSASTFMRSDAAPALANTAVTPGAYTAANITIDAQGRITAAANGSGGSGTVTTTGSPASGNLSKFSGATSITSGDLSGDVTTSGTLVTTLATVTVPKGGTGAVTLTNHGVLLGQGASAVAVTAAGTAGQVLTSNGASANPTFQSVGSSGSGAVAKLTILQKTANQSIANGTLTAASWDTTAVQDDIGAFSGASPTIVTVPSGYTKMRVSWYALWNSNSAGVRNTYVFKTGASSFPLLLGSAISAAVGSSESPNPHVSRWFTVATGDTYGIGLFQSSGGSLNFADTGTAATWGAPYVQFEWAP